MGVKEISTSVKNFENLNSVGKDALAIEGLELKADKDGFVLLAKGTVLYKYEGSATEVTLPKSVTVIADSAFWGNTAITKVALNNSVKTIGNNAFYGCKALLNISGTDEVTYVGKDALYDTEFLKALVGDKEGYCRMSTDETKPGYKVVVDYKGNEKKNVTVPADVTFLSNAFDSLKDTLESVTVRVDMKGICDGCFDGFSKLKTISVNNSSDEKHSLVIGSRAFAGTMITEFTVPAQIKSIADKSIWFTHAKTDTTVPPELFAVPTYQRLIKAGGKNVHFTYWDKVEDLSGKYTKSNGEPHEYYGHWSWIYTLNNDCKLDFDGKPVQVNGKDVGIIEWLGAQKRTK
jgi:hypothetical protein